MTKKYVHPSNDHKAEAMRRMENARLEWERQQADKTGERVTEKTDKLTVYFDAKAA